MLADLEALTPPLIMAAAFLIGLTFFLRHQMSPRDHSADDAEEADIPGGASNDDPGDVAPGSSSDQHRYRQHRGRTAVPSGDDIASAGLKTRFSM